MYDAQVSDSKSVLENKLQLHSDVVIPRTAQTFVWGCVRKQHSH
jgi:hypothetical protein